MKAYLFGSALACAVAVGTSHAQLVVGINNSSADISAWVIDIEDGSSRPLFGDVQIDGAAADDDGEAIYISSGTMLLRWNYGSLTPPTSVGEIRMSDGKTLSMAGLTWVDGKLYGTNRDSIEGIYEINPATGLATQILAVQTFAYDLHGMAYDDVTQRFYVIDNNLAFGSGIFSIDIFGGGELEHVANYPSFGGRVGLAAGGGRVYLLSGFANVPIEAYDLVGGTGYSGVRSPIPVSFTSGGGAWAPNLLRVPSPGAATGLVLGLTLLHGRRRRAAR